MPDSVPVPTPDTAALDPIDGLVVQGDLAHLFDDLPMQPCGNTHRTGSWLINCSCKPTARELVEAARASVDETGADAALLDMLSHAYFETWVIHDQQHVEQWPLALVLLATLRRAGYDVRRPANAT